MKAIRQIAVDLKARWNALFRRGELWERVDEEMRFHVEMRAERLMAAGMTPERAYAEAGRGFGNRAVIREAALDMWRYGSMERLMQDIRYAVRMLRRSPGFTSVAVLSLALGIGANAAIFTLIDRVMLRLLPVERPGELVILEGQHSYSRYEFFRDRSADTFAGVLGVANVSRIGVDGSEEAGSFAEGRLVSGNYFDVLGVKPLLGRLLSASDDQQVGAHPVVVVSHAFWQRYFHGDPAAVGRTIRLSPGTLSSSHGTGGFEEDRKPTRIAGGGQFTVIGVTQPGFFGETVGQQPDFWAPMMMQEHFMPGRAWLKRETAFWVVVMARLKPGVRRSQAQTAANALLQRALREKRGEAISEAELRKISQRRLELKDGEKGLSSLREEFSKPLIALMAMVGVVLLMACANLANLLLARSSARRREISIRLAIGSGRGRIVRQLLTESVVLATAGAAGAVAVAWWGSRAMFAMVSEGDTVVRLDLAPDLRTFAFTAGVALVTVLLFGLAPALRAARLDVNSALKDGGQTATGRWTAGRALVAVQVALSVILLTGTGLFTRTLYNMKAQDLGYSPERLLVMKLDPVSGGYKGDEIGRVCRDVLEKVRQIPGVSSATFSENGLFSGTDSGASVKVEGYTPSSDRDSMVSFDQVGPGYFTKVGIPLRSGRDFTDADGPSAQKVVVINENMARFYFGNRNPLGRVIRDVDQDGFALTVIGVAGNARDHSLRREVQRRMYVPFLQPIDGLTGANYEVRTAMPPAAMASALRAAVREVDPKLQVVKIKPLQTMIDEWILQERLIAKLSVLFGVIAILLASVGLYGVLAYAVVRRTNEIGIRMAIGAGRRDIVLMVVGETLLLVAAGIVVGIGAALGLSRYLESLLFGLKPHDALTIAGVIGLTVVITLVAAMAPARRAAGVDPLRALRYE